MNERVIRKRIKAMALFVLLLTVVLGGGTGAILTVLKKVQVEVRRSSIEKELAEYKKLLDRQFESDFQILNTLIPFLEDLDNITAKQSLISLEKANRNNSFVKMAYYNRKKEGVQVDINEVGSKVVDWELLEKPLQNMIESAFHEEKTISEVYKDSKSGQYQVGYGVPIYKNGEVEGALIGINNLDIYSEILSKYQSEISDFELYMLNKEGEVLLSSTKDSINSKNEQDLSQADKEMIIKMIETEEAGSSSLMIHGRAYPIYVQPVNVNGWYIVYVDTSYGSSDSIQYLITIVAVMTIGILILYVLFVFWCYRLFWKSIRELIQIAYYDKLTGAYNFDRFRQKINENIPYEKRHSIVVLNIRRFRYINDVLGMKKADKILCEVKKVIENALKSGEIYCRRNGDQFCLFLEETEQEIIKRRITTIQDNISKISDYIDNNYKVTTSVGVSIQETEESGKSWEEKLLHQAEFAMKNAKTGHKNEIVFYNHEIYKTDFEQGSIENEMEKALMNGEFHLFLQPKVVLKDGKIKGAEALVRWIKEDGTMIYPDLFIPAFEKNGFCTELDLYMVEQACKALREWIDKGYEPIQISVNQSKMLFYQPNYIDKLCKIRKKYEIPPQMITLEILEGLAVENIEELNKIMKKLQEKGFQISMDDFGAGYSSLNILGSLEINELKLDRQFLMPTSYGKKEKQQSVMKNIVQLAKDLSITIVVEGVETKENEDFIKSIGCNIGQGYYYSRPIPVKEFTEQFMEENESYIF